MTPEAAVRKKRGMRTVDWKKLKKMKALYLLAGVPFLFLLVFNYLPMYGVLIAFKNYRFVDGIYGSEWNQFLYYREMWGDSLFRRALRNTIVISLAKIIFLFPLPILFALLLNEMRHNGVKRVVQSISYLPHFLSWVVIGGFVYQILSPEIGLLNTMLSFFGAEPVHFISKSNLFIPILLSATTWATVGWSSIIYLAAISAVDPGLYESAEIDGANRLQKAIYITIPSILSAIIILFILGLASILQAGFDPIFNLYNPLVMDVADVIDTFVYRKGLLEAKFGYATAVGLFQSVIGIVLILVSNKIIKRYSDYGVW